MIDVDPWLAVGVVAAAVGIVAWLGSVVRWCRARWQRRRSLRDRLDEVERQNQVLVGTAAGLSLTMVHEGVTWSGWRIPAPELTGGLETLNELDRALERLHAQVRGVRAEPAVERLRADIEQALTILRRGVDLYRQGTWATYRTVISDETPRTFRPEDPATGRRRYMPSAAGEEPVPALHSREAVEEVRRLARDLDLCVRSAWYQIGDEDRAGAFTAGWPMRTYELGL